MYKAVSKELDIHVDGHKLVSLSRTMPIETAHVVVQNNLQERHNVTPDIYDRWFRTFVEERLREQGFD